MADKDKDTTAAPAEVKRAEPAAPLVIESEDSRRNRGLAEAGIEAKRLKMDETKPGGRYKVGDIYVDANGKEIKD